VLTRDKKCTKIRIQLCRAFVSYDRTPRHARPFDKNSSADEVSVLQPQPSWTRFHHSSAPRPLVVDSLELGWKPISSVFTQAYIRTPLRTFVEERIILYYIFTFIFTDLRGCTTEYYLNGTRQAPVKFPRTSLDWKNSPNRIVWKRCSCCCCHSTPTTCIVWQWRVYVKRFGDVGRV